MSWIHCLLLLFALSITAGATTIKNTMNNTADIEFAAIEGLVDQKIGKLILTDIYQELGLKIQIMSFSSNRAQYEANFGPKAGEVMRVWSYGDINKNLIRVPTPYYSITTSAFSLKKSAITINNIHDLKGCKITRLRGIKHTKNITKDLPFISKSSSSESMFKLVQQGNVDIALTNYMEGTEILKTLKLEDEIVASAPLAEQKLYHYLHKDHKALVSKVDDVIKKFKRNGKLAQITAAAEHAVLKDKQTPAP
jgi:hypothetical protein